MENNGTRGKRIQSVEKAMALLDAFWRAQRPLALSELVAVTGWPKSTLHALLLSMEQNSVIEQELSTGKYRLGFHLFELGCVAESWRGVKEIAQVSMRKFTEECGEPIYLAKLVNDYVLLIAGSEIVRTVRISALVGSRLPLYCSSQGKMILAHLPPSEISAYLKACRFHPFTPHTITNPNQLQRQLHQIRLQGYSISNEELRTGAASVAAPIFDKEGRCEYAVGAVVPILKSKENPVRPAIRDLVLSVAAEITRQLQGPAGWNGRDTLCDL